MRCMLASTAESLTTKKPDVTFTARPASGATARLLGLLHQDAGNVLDAAEGKLRRQVERHLDGMARGQRLVGGAAKRERHGGGKTWSVRALYLGLHRC